MFCKKHVSYIITGGSPGKVKSKAMQKEAKARILINDLLKRSGWRFFDDICYLKSVPERW